jgi:thioredoxin-related protein
MKKLAPIVGLLLLASLASAQTAKILTGPFDEALAQAKRQNKLILLDFFSSGWGACKLLVQQFYNNPKYADFLNNNFIVYRASRGDKIGDTIYEKFNIQGTPTELFVDKDGKEVDWIVGYGPPADKFLEKIKKVLSGEETFKALSARYAKEPTNVEVLFKLGQKYSSRFTPEMTAKGKELYKKVIALDPEGKAGSYTDDYLKAQIPYTQGAEYELGQASAFDHKPDPAPLQAFIKKYPTSALVKNAYSYLAYYYGSQAPKAEATKFFEEYTAKYPEDRNVIGSYVERIIKDKEPVDKGITLAEKLKELAG